MSDHHQLHLKLSLLLLVVGLSGCSPQSGGPRVWLDQPLDGGTLPMGPVTLLAHAADVDGLDSIEFKVDGAPVGEVAVDAERFGEAGFEWLPPGPGTYSLEVVALDAAGGRGTSALVKIIIAEAGLLSYGTPTPTPAPWTPVSVTGVVCGPGRSVGITYVVTHPQGIKEISVFGTWRAFESTLTLFAPYPTMEQRTVWMEEDIVDDMDRPHQWGVRAIVVGEANPAFGYAYEPGPDKRCPGHYEGSPQLAATPGLKALWIARLNTNCRIGPGTAYDSQDVIESGGQAPIDGKNAEGTWFRVQPPGSSRTCWVSTASGDVQGELASVPVITAAPMATATATPAPANQPPVIQDFSASPGLILTDGSGCPAYSRTVTLSAVVSDDAGIDSVVAQWSLGSLSGETTLLPAGGDNYSGAVGPVTQVGTMSINLIARDASGGSASSGPLTVSVQNCIE